MRVPWTARRSNQSILKENSPEYSLEGLMLKLKLILWLPDEKNCLIRKDPGAGKSADHHLNLSESVTIPSVNNNEKVQKIARIPKM